jgi:AraC-like DNA-binding protein
MALLFKYSPEQPTFYRNAISANDLNAKELVESTDTIGMDHAGMTFQNWLFDGFRLAHSVVGQVQPTSYAINNDIDAVKIYFNRRGRSLISYRQLSSDFSLGTGQYNMLYSAGLDSQMSHIDDHSEMFSLQITRERFMSLLGQGHKGLDAFTRNATDKRPALFSDQWLSISPAMDKCIDEILNCHFSYDLKKLYLHSKAVELFVLFAHTCSSSSALKSALAISPADRERLYFVKDHLTAHYADPLSFTGLAKTAGLNEFKLKTGFKALFNTSVIDFLINYRLEQARELLLNTSMTIAEVAYETGYASPAYFSKAYRKKYGLSPKQR